MKTPGHLWHCRDSSKVKSLHLGPAISLESPAPREPVIQMIGALTFLQLCNIAVYILHGRVCVMVDKEILKCSLSMFNVLRPLKMKN